MEICHLLGPSFLVHSCQIKCLFFLCLKKLGPWPCLQKKNISNLNFKKNERPNFFTSWIFFWYQNESIRAVFWPYQGRILAVSGPYQGRILAVSGPYQGRILAVSGQKIEISGNFVFFQFVFSFLVFNFFPVNIPSTLFLSTVHPKTRPQNFRRKINNPNGPDVMGLFFCEEGWFGPRAGKKNMCALSFEMVFSLAQLFFTKSGIDKYHHIAHLNMPALCGTFLKKNTGFSQTMRKQNHKK